MGMGAIAPAALLLLCCLLCLANAARAHSAKRLLLVKDVNLDLAGKLFWFLNTQIGAVSSSSAPDTSNVVRNQAVAAGPTHSIHSWHMSLKQHEACLLSIITAAPASAACTAN